MVEAIRELEEAVTGGTLVSAVLSRPLAAGGPRRVTIRPVTVRGERRFQWAIREGKRESHENLAAGETVGRASEWFGSVFGDLHLATADREITATLSGGRVALSVRRAQHDLPPAVHDRAPRHLIPEGEPCAFLEATGVMTAEGRVRAAHRRKFRQVNRFLEMVEDVYQDLPEKGPIGVVDVGCGKASLTFAVHHLLTSVHGREVSLHGVDAEPSVVATSRQVAERLGLAGVEFHHAGAASFSPPGPVHLVLALHACDTATDDALARAVEWGAAVILAVPCCQKEVADRMDPARFGALAAHGLLRERLAALATDALRAAVLESEGYRVQLLELVDPEDTPKNLLIRAVRRSPAGPATASGAVAGLKDMLGIDAFHLERALARRPS